jgi:hypothetical protein
MKNSSTMSRSSKKEQRVVLIGLSASKITGGKQNGMNNQKEKTCFTFNLHFK